MFPQMGVADVGPQPELPVGSHRRQSPPTHWSSPPARATQSASAAQSTQAFAAALPDVPARVLVFGGAYYSSAPGLTCLDDFWLFDADAGEWHALEPPG